MRLVVERPCQDHGMYGGHHYPVGLWPQGCECDFMEWCCPGGSGAVMSREEATELLRARSLGGLIHVDNVVMALFGGL
jgi:hypothetical protein